MVQPTWKSYLHSQKSVASFVKTFICLKFGHLQVSDPTTNASKWSAFEHSYKIWKLLKIHLASLIIFPQSFLSFWRAILSLQSSIFISDPWENWILGLKLKNGQGIFESGVLPTRAELANSVNAAQIALLPCLAWFFTTTPHQEEDRVVDRWGRPGNKRAFLGLVKCPSSIQMLTKFFGPNGIGFIPNEKLKSSLDEYDSWNLFSLGCFCVGVAFIMIM